MDKFNDEFSRSPKFVVMTYRIDTDGTGSVGSTLRTTAVELRECGVAFSYAGGLVASGVAADHLTLRRAVDEFVATHLAAIVAIASASGGLGRGLTWAAQSAHEVELSTAAALGSQRVGVTTTVTGAGAR